MKKKKFNKKLILIVYKLIFIEFFMYEMCFSFYLIIYFYLALINLIKKLLFILIIIFIFKN